MKITRCFTIAAFIMSNACAANAQSSSKNILDLDPNIIAAATCNGSLFAVSMFNFESGILNEERARVMLRTTTLAFWLTATKHQSVQHLREYAIDYDKLFSDSYESTYDDLVDGNYTWDSQAGVDVCTARIFEPLTSVTEHDMQRSGIPDYFQFSAAIAADADKRFDYILNLMRAMQ
jgi:hypothetical protein